MLHVFVPGIIGLVLRLLFIKKEKGFIVTIAMLVVTAVMLALTFAEFGERLSIYNLWCMSATTGALITGIIGRPIVKKSKNQMS